MPSIKEVVERIGSVKSTQQITQAMKLVAVAKLSKVQDQVLAMRPYAAASRSLLKRVLAQQTNVASPLMRSPDPSRKGKTLLLVMGSDRGLCGGYNLRVTRLAQTFLTQSAETGPVEVWPIGKKILSFFEKQPFPVSEEQAGLAKHPTFERAACLASNLIELFVHGHCGQIAIAYNRFKSAAVQVPVLESFLPIDPTSQSGAEPVEAIDYLYEPSPEELTKQLIPSVLKVQLYQTLLESAASEHGARMTTMSKATENADDLLKNLRLAYNRTRQAVITREISEIVAGADSLQA